VGGRAQNDRIKDEAGRMKLDYLQFLDLEVFTRFGARLEAAMEAALRRGRLLRELLKQDRLSPLPIECQMAWLVGFNDGQFDKLEPEAVADIAATLASQAGQSRLTLESPREAWSDAVAGWLGRPEAGQA
jgi:F-type H+-transporting ATPase subunit alpha